MADGINGISRMMAQQFISAAYTGTKSGTVDKDEFLKVLQSVAKTKGVSDSDLETAFTKIAGDDGVIDEDEMALFLEENKPKGPPPPPPPPPRNDLLDLLLEQILKITGQEDKSGTGTLNAVDNIATDTTGSVDTTK
jgi:hypothetical protein